jgi:hypothetical protein
VSNSNAPRRFPPPSRRPQPAALGADVPHPRRGLRPTQEESLRIQLAQELSYLPDLIEGVAYACKALGEANRMKKPMRRFWQGKAMRGINAERARVRTCRKAIATLQAQLLTLAH